MQKSLSIVSQRGQVRRLTDLARQALEAYTVPAVRVTPLKLVYNKTFRITTQSGEQYLLRLCHPRRTSLGAVRSELLWLTALRQEAGLPVPEPVPNKHAQEVTVITDGDMPQPCFCALFHWTKGRFLYQTLTPWHLVHVGNLMARLHHHATYWQKPAGFIRRRADNLNPLDQEHDDHFDETIAARVIQTVATLSTPQAGAIVATVIRKIWAVLQALGEAPDTFGLIHADFHHNNYLFHNGQAGVIDFDDCGYGHWLYDLAVTLYCLRNHPNFFTLREAFLSGYRQSRSLTREQEGYLGAFMALRTLQDLLWTIETRDQAAFQDTWQTHMINRLQELQEFATH